MNRSWHISGFGVALFLALSLKMTFAMELPSFWRLVSRSGVQVGTAIAYEPLREDPVYVQILNRHFNLVTPENEMKFEVIHPEEGRYDWTKADALVEFAHKNGKKVRGHPLVWHRQVAPWVLRLPTSTAEDKAKIRSILREHIYTVVSRYRDLYPGLVVYWDVANELISDDGGKPRESIWLKAFGSIDSLMEASFRWAHEADPTARLFYNDYAAEDLGPKSDAVYQLVRGLRERGVPIHGVGLQMHLNSFFHLSPRLNEVRPNMERLAKLGMQVHVTEMDYMISHLLGSAEMEQQARAFAQVFNACLGVPACKVFSVWGFTDRYSWIPTQPYGPFTGRAHLYDEHYREKGTYRALFEAMSRAPRLPRSVWAGRDP